MNWIVVHAGEYLLELNTAPPYQADGGMPNDIYPVIAVSPPESYDKPGCALVFSVHKPGLVVVSLGRHYNNAAILHNARMYYQHIQEEKI